MGQPVAVRRRDERSPQLIRVRGATIPMPSPRTDDLLAVGIDDVETASKAVADVAWRTPLLPASRHEEEIYLKLEALQRTGSFKIRGAWNNMRQADASARDAGFVTVSAGNHGQAVAWSAGKLEAPCTVWVPEDAVEGKVEAMRALGASIERLPHEEIMETMVTRGFPKADEETYVHPFGDPRTVAGQGTVGLEILEDRPDVGTVLVPVGGGGLASGIGTAIQAKAPDADVYGVQVEGSAPLVESFRSGEAEVTGPPETVADGVATDRVFEYMWPLLSDRLDGALAVPEDLVLDAMGHLASECHVVAEGAGAVALAAAREHRDDLASPIVAVVSGGNVDRELLERVLGRTG